LSLAIAAPLFWGSTFTLAKPTVAHFPPLLFMCFAYAIVAVVTMLTLRKPFRTPWQKSIVIAACCVTIQGALLFIGIKGVDASTANLVLQTQVPAAVFLSWALAGEILTLRKISGTAVALAGVAIIIGLPEQRPAVIPIIMIVVSGFVWALGQVLVRLWGREEGPMALKANALYGLPQLIVCTLLFESGQWHSIISATPQQWLVLGFVCIVGFYLAYMCWFKLLEQVPVDAAVPFILLMTPIGILTAVMFLGESITRWQIIGGTVLMLGLAIVNGVGRGWTRRRIGE
jgi:O-acetylserine/cysteine efflux transporter